MAVITPKFRAESWYGRLYRRAYGDDRGWIVEIRRLFGTTGFEGFDPPEITARQMESEVRSVGRRLSEDELMAMLADHERRVARARATCLAFLRLPPYEEPFFTGGRPVAICPVFWKIVLALVVYVPFVVVIGGILAAFASVIGGCWRAIVAAVLAPIGVFLDRHSASFAGSAVVSVVLAIAIGIGLVVGDNYGRKLRSVEYAGLPVSAAQLAREDVLVRARLPELRRQFSERCGREIHLRRSLRRMDDGDTVAFVATIERQADFWECTATKVRLIGFPPGWKYTVRHRQLDDESRGLPRLFGDHHNDRYMLWLGWKVAQDLRRQYAPIFAAEDARRAVWAAQERAEANARHEALAWAGFERLQAILGPLRSYPAALYDEMERWCDFTYDGGRAYGMMRMLSQFGFPPEEWAALEDGCGLAAQYFSVEIAEAFMLRGAQEVEREARHVAFLRRYRAQLWNDVRHMGAVLGIVFGFVLLVLVSVFALTAFVMRYAQGIDRALRALAEMSRMLLLAVTSPIWILPYLTVAGWRSAAVVAWRADTRRAFIETWQLVRAYARAVKERVCPFIEWTDLEQNGGKLGAGR